MMKLTALRPSFTSKFFRNDGNHMYQIGLNAISVQKPISFSTLSSRRKNDWQNYRIREFSTKDKKDADTKEIKNDTTNQKLAENQPTEQVPGNKLTPDQKPSTDPSKTYYGATVQRIGSTLHFAEQKYEDFEKQVMSRLQESNRRRFRLYFFGSIGAIVAVTLVFGRSIRQGVSEQTAAIAKETLENESLKIQTQELAMAVVQTVLNDKEITAHAAAFLKEASTTPETQKALLDLTLHVLQHPQTFEELVVLGKRLIHNLTNDKQVVQELADVFLEVLKDPHLQEAAVNVMAKLFHDPEIVKSAMELVIAVVQKQETQKAVEKLAQDTSTSVLDDQQILSQSRQFIAEVMGDDLLQKEGGNALINTVYHALKPGMIRIAGFTVCCVSFVAFRLFLNPY